MRRLVEALILECLRRWCMQVTSNPWIGVSSSSRSTWYSSASATLARFSPVRGSRLDSTLEM